METSVHLSLLNYCPLKWKNSVLSEVHPEAEERVEKRASMHKMFLSSIFFFW